MPALILLAAGRSTRFGRPKQLEPVGPKGEALMDFTLQQALQAGCKEARIVVRPEHWALFAQRYSRDPRIKLVEQDDALGTAHAVMQALPGLHATAVIANADDLYGRDAVRSAVHHALYAPPDEHALVAFRLGRTLSPGGGVNRAVCTASTQGMLVSTQEVTGLLADGSGKIHDAAGGSWSSDTFVSMNLWVLRPSHFPLFRHLFAVRGTTSGEFGLPAVVHAALQQGHRFRLLPTDASWCGLTHPADAEHVRHMLLHHP